MPPLKDYVAVATRQYLDLLELGKTLKTPCNDLKVMSTLDPLADPTGLLILNLTLGLIVAPTELSLS